MKAKSKMLWLAVIFIMLFSVWACQPETEDPTPEIPDHEVPA